jgi:hypothetical protein
MAAALFLLKASKSSEVTGALVGGLGASSGANHLCNISYESKVTPNCGEDLVPVSLQK